MKELIKTKTIVKTRCDKTLNKIQTAGYFSLLKLLEKEARLMNKFYMYDRFNAYFTPIIIEEEE